MTDGEELEALERRYEDKIYELAMIVEHGEVNKYSDTRKKCYELVRLCDQIEEALYRIHRTAMTMRI